MIRYAQSFLLFILVACGTPYAGGEISLSDTAKPDSTAKITEGIPVNYADSTIAGSSTATDKSASRNYIKAAADSSWWYRKLKNNVFGVGERLEFSVKYGMLPAGVAVMEIPEIIDYDGHPCYRMVSIAHSNNVVSVFYKVRDTVETLVDYDGIFPRRFRKHLQEGSYKTERVTYFDQRRHLAITGSDTIPTYAFVQDAFSSLYFARTQELIPGQSILIDNHTDRKNYPLKLIVCRKEVIEVPAGKFDCVVVEPVMRVEGIFKSKGRIWIWLTDDRYKIPVMMKTEVFFLGSITARLKSYTLGKIEGDGG